MPKGVYKRRPESILKMRKTMKRVAKEKGFGKWMSGKRHSEESNKKRSASLKGRVPWNKGKFGKLCRITRDQLRIWKKRVFERDDYTCQLCGYNGKHIEAHHKKPKAEYPELAFDVENGITLCNVCHCKVDDRRAQFGPTMGGKLKDVEAVK